MITLSTQARNSANDAILGLINAGFANPNGYIEIRTGTKPNSPQDPASGVRLATLQFSLPAFGASVNGIATANPIAGDPDIAETGVAGWFRIYDRNGNPVLDGEITLTGAGGDLEFDNVNFIKGGTVNIITLNAVMPP